MTTLQVQPAPKRRFNPSDEEQERQCEDAIFRCAELVLQWLTPQELAIFSLSCHTLYRISKSIALGRVSDASRNLESVRIPFLNAVDDHPYAYFIYTRSAILPNQCLLRQSWGSISHNEHSSSMSRFVVESSSMVDEWGGGVSGCDCENCGDSEASQCSCLSLHGLDGLVSECGPFCRCGIECPNRSTQQGISTKLKIVRDRRKGWGLYSDEFIRKGQFVCEYAGELLPTEEARRRQRAYDKLSLSGHFTSALLVVREHLPSGKACLRINIDATRVGNVARFINHSCDGGNLSTVLVRMTGALLPRLCFFASRDINKDDELAFSYGSARILPRSLQCFCGSSCCFGTLPSEQT